MQKFHYVALENINQISNISGFSPVDTPKNSTTIQNHCVLTQTCSQWDLFFKWVFEVSLLLCEPIIILVT